MPRLTTKLVRLREACEVLGISRRTFWRRWHSTFTDPRGPEDRRDGIERKVYEDELAAAVNAGTGSRAVAAVYAQRKAMGRLGR